MKTRLLLVGLLLFTLWPLGHRLLVTAFGLNPWKFAGWAMYAVPAFEPDVYLMRVTTNGSEQLPPATWSPRVRKEWRHYRARRTHLGQLTGRPNALGQSLLADHPEGAAVMVVVQVRRIDRDSARIQADREEYTYLPARR